MDAYAVAHAPLFGQPIKIDTEHPARPIFQDVRSTSCRSQPENTLDLFSAMADRPDSYEDSEEHDEIPYVSEDEIDFSVITMGLKRLPFFQDDTYLGMQAMNVGVVDALITKQEYGLLRKQIEEERTPTDLAHMISALSQMWMFALYEVLRMWRDRRFEFTKLAAAGGIDAKLGVLDSDDGMNATIEVRRRQLTQYRDNATYRQEIEAVWAKLEPAYRMIELFRMNLAKHAAPGKDSVMPRAPGYGRINRWCGSMDYELIDREGHYSGMNRRDIADALRATLKEVKPLKPSPNGGRPSAHRCRRSSNV